MNDYLQQPLILVIDDESDVLGEVAVRLDRCGLRLPLLRYSQRPPCRLPTPPTPDLIISDINLDGQSGLDLCAKRSEQADALSDVPVMFLSGAQVPDIIRRSHAVGGTYYLRKPFDPDVLMELVDKALWMPHLVTRYDASPPPRPGRRRRPLEALRWRESGRKSQGPGISSAPT